MVKDKDKDKSVDLFLEIISNLLYNTPLTIKEVDKLYFKAKLKVIREIEELNRKAVG